MSIIIIKRNFVPPDTKSLCRGKNLKSGKAYYLYDINNKKLLGYAGKECATQYSNTDLSVVPDFANALISLSSNDNTNNNSDKNNKKLQQNDTLKAIKYLLLRQEILKEKGFIGVEYVIFDKYYNEYKETQSLSKEAVNHILNIESHKNTPKQLKLENLLTCYAYYYVIDLAI